MHPITELIVKAFTAQEVKITPVLLIVTGTKVTQTFNVVTDNSRALGRAMTELHLHLCTNASTIFLDEEKGVFCVITMRRFWDAY